jgi:hypothetical protein
MKRFAVLAIALSSLLALGATAANAHRGPGHGRVGASALVTQAAKQLDVTRAKLKASIVGAAEARIDEAVEDGDVDADEAAELKEEVADNLAYAMRISRTRAVASRLGVTTARLNAAFRAARKTLIVARIDRAVANDDLTAAEAAELKSELDEEDLPGYKGGFGGGGGRGPGR